MIIGLGTDIAEVARIAKSIENISFKEKVFSKTEIAYCETKVNKAESFAARFAAKEAFFKALGTGWRGGMAFNEVEVVNDELGKPSLVILGTTAEIIKEKNIKVIHVSLSHVKEMAMATVILEGPHPLIPSP
jgi:holo-[acyl-carrier protein] synthase